MSLIEILEYAREIWRIAVRMTFRRKRTIRVMVSSLVKTGLYSSTILLKRKMSPRRTAKNCTWILHLKLDKTYHV